MRGVLFFVADIGMRDPLYFALAKYGKVSGLGSFGCVQWYFC